MEIVFDPRQTHYSVSIIYSEKEWRNLESRYRENNYERYTTQNLFGRGITADVYRYPSYHNVIMLYHIVVSELERMGRGYADTIGFIDDINRPPINVSRRKAYVFNLAVFRIIPSPLTSDKVVTSFDVPPEITDMMSDERFTAALAVIGKLANPEFKRIRVLIE
jgi:hypothetical protein